MKNKGIMQNDANDCGVACLATICLHFNYKMPLIKFRELMQCDAEGISMYDICKAADKIQIDTEALYATWQELCEEVIAKKKLPIIVHTKTKDGFYHYVVVKKYQYKKVYVFDPAEGNKVYSKKEFQDIWTGNLITFSKKESFSEYNYKLHYQKYFKIISEYKKQIFEVLLFSIIIIGIEVIGATVYQQVVDTYILGDEVSSLKRQIGLFIENIHILFSLVLFLYLIDAVISVFRGMILAKILCETYKALFSRFVNKILNFSLKYYIERKNADVLNRFTTIKEAGNIFIGALVEIVLDSIMVSTSMVILAGINKELFWIVLVIIILYLIIVLLYRNPLKINSRSIAESENELLSYLKESTEGIETIKAYNYEIKREENFNKSITSYLKKIVSGNKLYVTKSGIENYIERAGNITVFWIGSVLVVKGIVSLGELIVFQTLVAFFLDPIKRLVELQQEIQNAAIYFRRLDDVYEAEEEKSSVKEEKLEDHIEQVEYVNVSFSYNSHQLCLNDINLHIKKGEKIAFIGASGSGKTTLLKLITKLYEPDKGQILINGININNIDTQSIRSKIVFASQSMLLFADTIKNNLVMGNEEISEDEIDTVLNICSIYEVLFKHNFSLDSYLAEDGSNLSSGERQKLIIARGLLKKPEVMVLDEVTSNLDDKTEKELWNGIFHYYKDTTFLIVSHKKEVIKYTDRVCTMENGRITSENSSDKFINEGGKL